mmetsp:Transcript_1686/g.3686  ORF Transcript_1686/g.3686 Transcript_1686/m.3686 type:complete len:212 (-) Transcript_1686:328-963(-)
MHPGRYWTWPREPRTSHSSSSTTWPNSGPRRRKRRPSWDWIRRKTCCRWADRRFWIVTSRTRSFWKPPTRVISAATTPERGSPPKSSTRRRWPLGSATWSRTASTPCARSTSSLSPTVSWRSWSSPIPPTRRTGSSGRPPESSSSTSSPSWAASSAAGPSRNTGTYRTASGNSRLPGSFEGFWDRWSVPCGRTTGTIIFTLATTRWKKPQT